MNIYFCDEIISLKSRAPGSLVRLIEDKYFDIMVHYTKEGREDTYISIISAVIVGNDVFLGISYRGEFNSNEFVNAIKSVLPDKILQVTEF